MKLHVDPPPALDVLQQELDLVVCIREGEFPDVHTTENSPKPDRHFLLGVLQTAMIAVAEMDPETVVLIDTQSLTLERNNELTPLNCQLIIIISKTRTAFAVLTGTDKTLAKRLIGDAARRFTGTIRLDIP